MFWRHGTEVCELVYSGSEERQVANCCEDRRAHSGFITWLAYELLACSKITLPRGVGRQYCPNHVTWKCLQWSALETPFQRFEVLIVSLPFFPLDLHCQVFHIRKFTKTLAIIKTVTFRVPVVLMCESVPPCCWRRQYRCLSPHCYWRHLGKPSNRTVSRLLIALSFAVLDIRVVKPSDWSQERRVRVAVSQTSPLVCYGHVFRLIHKT